MKRTRTAFGLGVVAACCLLRGERLHGQPEGMDEEKATKVKAAYLLNFTKFVTWPADVFENEHSPIIIGVVGADPFGSVLDQTLAEKTVSGRRLETRRFPTVQKAELPELKRCHLLYFSPSLGAETERLIRSLSKAPILLVGEGAVFAEQGGALGFLVEEGRIIFWANAKAAETANLQLSSQLLKLARLTEVATVVPDKKNATGTGGASDPEGP